MPTNLTPAKLTNDMGRTFVPSQTAPPQDAPASVNRRAFLAASMGAGLSACGASTEEPPAEKASSVTLSDALARDALGQAELVRSGAVQPIELVEAVIARIEELNPKLNAIVTPMYDLAREAAQANVPEGPFHGVPFLLKDLGATYAGVRYTAGSKALAENISRVDSELVVRQKRAGLITVAKTNTPEWGLTATTEPHLVWAGPQSLGLGEDTRRIERRLRRGCRGAHRPHGARQRWRRIDSYTGILLRFVRTQTYPGAQYARSQGGRHLERPRLRARREPDGA